VEESQALLIKREIKKKATVLAQGFRKRDKSSEAEYYERLIDSLTV